MAFLVILSVLGVFHDLKYLLWNSLGLSLISFIRRVLSVSSVFAARTFRLAGVALSTVIRLGVDFGFGPLPKHTLRSADTLDSKFSS